MTIVEWIQEHKQEYPNKGELVAACAQALNVTKKSVAQKISRHRINYNPSTSKRSLESSGPRCGDRTAEFRKRFDKSFRIPLEVHKQIEGWLSQANIQWCFDDELKQRCAIKNIVDWKKYARENPEFEDLIFEADKKIIWCCSPEKRNELLRVSLS